LEFDFNSQTKENRILLKKSKMSYNKVGEQVFKPPLNQWKSQSL